MKFLFTFNMPSKNFPVHQIVVEIPVENCSALTEFLNENDFICVEHYYIKTKEDGRKELEEKGDMVVNTAHIGKATQYY